PHAPAGPERLALQPVDDRVDALGRDDARPQQVPDVGRERVDLLLVAVEAERVVAAALLAPERLVEASAELVRIPLEPVGELAVAPHLARELGDAPLRVVDVTL